MKEYQYSRDEGGEGVKVVKVMKLNVNFIKTRETAGSVFGIKIIRSKELQKIAIYIPYI